MTILNFSELKKSRSASLAKINGELEKLNTSSRKSDDRFWEPTVDKGGNGYAVIRFLPAPKGEDAPFIRRYDHGFKGPMGKWYIDLSRSTIGEEDPVSDMNRELWNQGEGSEGRKIVSGTVDFPGSKRRLHYIANIMVIQDTAKPENEGKVFLYKFGKKIFDKLNDVMNPKFEDETAVNPFDFWEGAPFKLKIRKFEGYRNYDKSEFGPVAPLSDDDAELERIWGMEHSLAKFLDPSEYKSYDELKRKLNMVMSGVKTLDENETPRQEPRAPRAQERASAPIREVDEVEKTESDDVEDFFNKLKSQ